MKLTFERGTILIKGNARVPNSTWDERSKAFRTMALNYKDTIDFLKTSCFDCDDYVLNLILCPELQSNIKLRDYQKQALDAWVANDKRGIIVLPTGSGKTLIGIEAISLLNTPTIIVAPTLDLVDQWRSRLKEEFRIDVGVLGGGEQDIKALTVSTYDSAYIHADKLGNRFGLIIFDEVHHLPAEGYRNIAEMFAAPYRMVGGKTALANLNNTHNTTIKPNDLWIWGAVPLAHSVDNGSLADSFDIMNPGEDNGTMPTPSQEMGLNEAVETGEISSATAQNLDQSGNCASMEVYDKKGFDASANGIFDCTCYKTPKTAQFPEPTEGKAW